MSHSHDGEHVHFHDPSSPNHKHSHQSHQSTRNILIAFLLNLGFSIYEFIGGIFTGSTAIMSDSVHDFGDALSIGISFFLEKKSEKRPDSHYTYGYVRYSLVGGMITTLILLLGSIFVIVNAILRLFNPVEINYDGMILLAIIGVVINSIATYVTHRGDSLNQKSVNLHMLEDVLGWAVVLIGAVIMRFTDITYLDPILSIFVACFIFWHTIQNFLSILDVFLEKTPANISIAELTQHLEQIPNIQEVHHLHVWSIDGYHTYVTLHVITDSPSSDLKQRIRKKLSEHDIHHVTIEFETPKEHCHDHECRV